MSELKIPKQSTRIYLDFFNRHAEKVAKDLLGRVLVRETGKNSIYVRLEEIAAYEGEAKSMTKGALEQPGTIGVSTKYGKNLVDISTLGICIPSCVTLIAGTLFDRKGLEKHIDGPGNLAKALDIDRTYDGVPLNFVKIWIGGYPVEPEKILKRKLSKVPENCEGYFYFK